MIKGPYSIEQLHEMNKRFEYKGVKTREISFPLGGIGTGSIGLSGNGMLIDWEIFNRPNKNGSTNAASFFAIKAERDREVVMAKVLQGDLQPPYTAANMGREPYFVGHGSMREYVSALPHFKNTAFIGKFPIAEIRYQDDTDPLEIALEAFNPYIPLNDQDSSIPCAIFRYRVTNRSTGPLDVSLVASIANPHKVHAANSVFRESGLSGIHFTSTAYADDAPEYGDLTVATDHPDVSYQTYWRRVERFEIPLESFWDDFTQPGKLTDRQYDEPYTDTQNNPLLHLRSTGSLGAHRTLQPGEEHIFTFFITWHFPNFVQYWNPIQAPDEAEKRQLNQWKNYYATQYESSVETATYVGSQAERLYRETKQFQTCLFESSLPDAVLDAISANIATLKTTTCLRLTDGSLYGFEGSHCADGACEGSCTHVWNYAQVLPWLYPKLDRSMIELNYRYNLQPSGKMRFRLMLPLGRADQAVRFWDDYYAASDGQLTFVSRVYKHYAMTGDREWLQSIWSSVKRSLAYAWSNQNADCWDPDKQGILTGIQHNTLDKEMVGPNPSLSSQYILALLCASRMARIVGDTDGDEFERMAANGRRIMDERLFNGRYYVQRDADEYGKRWPDHRFFALGDGCYIDQVVGQWYAHMLGLGYMLDRENVRAALESVYERNFVSMRDVTNAWRIYALGDEWGALLCTWQKGEKPDRPIPYHSECWNGLEYQAASHMIYEGLIDEGLSLVQAVRDRYDGEKRNPWAEYEFGNHYARSMSSYSLLLALSGFHYDAERGVMAFAPRLNETGFRTFWCCGGAWGDVRITERALYLTVHYGEIELNGIETSLRLENGDFHVACCGKEVECEYENRTIRFRKAATFVKHDVLSIEAGSH